MAWVLDPIAISRFDPHFTQSIRVLNIKYVILILISIYFTSSVVCNMLEIIL